MNCFKCDKYLIKYLVLNNKVYNALCEYCYTEENNSRQQINNDDINKCLLCDDSQQDCSLQRRESASKGSQTLDKQTTESKICDDCSDLLKPYEFEIPPKKPKYDEKEEHIKYMLDLLKHLLTDIKQLEMQNDKLKMIIKKKLLDI